MTPWQNLSIRFALNRYYIKDGIFDHLD